MVNVNTNLLEKVKKKKKKKTLLKQILHFKCDKVINAPLLVNIIKLRRNQQFKIEISKGSICQENYLAAI